MSHQPDAIRPGVAAVVVNESGEVLLVKRADRDQWALPTGTVEPGESITAALERELREEVALEVSVERATGIYSDPREQVFEYPSGRAVHFVTTCFRCVPVGEYEVRPDGDEVTCARFFDPDDLPVGLLSMQPRWIEDARRDDERTPVR